MPADFEGFRETVNDGICLRTCFERITHILKKDGKFVASYSRYMRVGAKGVVEPNSDRLQERVAHEMARVSFRSLKPSRCRNSRSFVFTGRRRGRTPADLACQPRSR